MDFFVFHGALWGVFLIIALATFPRLSVLAMLIWGALTGGGVLWWLGFLFMPGVVVAYEATCSYWDTNPVLCVFAWLVAFCSFGGEAKTVHSKSSK